MRLNLDHAERGLLIIQEYRHTYIDLQRTPMMFPRLDINSGKQSEPGYSYKCASAALALAER